MRVKHYGALGYFVDAKLSDTITTTTEINISTSKTEHGFEFQCEQIPVSDGLSKLSCTECTSSKHFAIVLPQPRVHSTSNV